MDGLYIGKPPISGALAVRFSIDLALSSSSWFVKSHKLSDGSSIHMGPVLVDLHGGKTFSFLSPF